MNENLIKFTPGLAGFLWSDGLLKALPEPKGVEETIHAAVTDVDSKNGIVTFSSPSKGVYIALDNETGGLTDKTSLLTSYLIVLDKDFNPVAELHLRVKPNDGDYVVNGGALNVNKINLVEHDKVAITYSAAGKALRDFLIRHSDDGKQKLTPIGHRVQFDIKGLGDHLLNPQTIDKYMSYRVMDTGIYAQLFKHLGLLPDSASGSLESLVKHYDIKDQGFHTEKGDTLMTVDVLKAQLKVLKDLLVTK